MPGLPKTIVYVLRSETDSSKHYVGLTSDLARRVAGHNAGLNVHTARAKSWRVLVSLNFVDEKTAARFERYLKTGSGRAFGLRHFCPDSARSSQQGRGRRRRPSPGTASGGSRHPGPQPAQCYNHAVDPADLKAFARRNWALVSEAKTDAWIEMKRGMSVADMLELADGLRRHAMSVRPDWPSADDRADDHAVHVRVSEALRAVVVQPR